jgi:hypothetical protein
MAKITVMRSGVKGGVGSSGNNTPKTRGDCNGWSAGSARRNMNFLMTIDSNLINGPGFAFTFTIRDLPASHSEWARLIDNLRKFAYRNGAIRDHWVTEWTKAGKPHLHGIVYNDPENHNPSLPIQLEGHWLKLTKHLGTSSVAQHWRALEGLTGWLKYVSKHAGRGFAHYQRQKGELPSQWQKTGRMWGKGGQWPTLSAQYDLNQRAFFTFRRILKRYLVSQSRSAYLVQMGYNNKKDAAPHLKQLIYRRSMLKRNMRTKSEVRGINEWADVDITVKIMRYISLLDYHCVSRI